MQRSDSRLGSALRKVRLARGVSLEEAARDTRIRAEFLSALEEGEFDRLLGEVHVRGCLRSYATYLGLPADRVLDVYSQEVDQISAPVTTKPTPPPRLRPRRRRDDARLVIMGAVVVLVVAGAFGVLSARDPAPEPADVPPAPTPLQAPLPPGIDVAVFAQESVEVTVVIDGGDPKTYALQPGEGRSFEAATSLRLRLSSGSTAQVTVNGKNLGFPGKEGKPWRQSFQYGTSALPGTEDG